MIPFLYDCPITSQKVQSWLSYDPFEQGENTYESVTCIACRQTHLVNPKTGKAIGDAASPVRKSPPPPLASPKENVGRA
jgi:hypothetical protein